MARKTFQIETMLEFANKQLARTDKDATISFKIGIIGMIEKILLDSKNYNGFMFLNTADCKFNTMGYYTRKYY